MISFLSINRCLLDHQYRPKNPRELFNLQNSMARNVVERIFGILKCQFSLMVASPEYSENKQVKFVSAFCVLHNFISVYNQDFMDVPSAQQLPLLNGHDHHGSQQRRSFWLQQGVTRLQMKCGPITSHTLRREISDSDLDVLEYCEYMGETTTCSFLCVKLR